MVGDRMNTDVVAGLEAGLETVLVLNGSDPARRHGALHLPRVAHRRLDRGPGRRARVTTGGRPAGAAKVVLGVDLGTTATKAVAYDAAGRELGGSGRSVPARRARAGLGDAGPGGRRGRRLHGHPRRRRAARERERAIEGCACRPPCIRSSPGRPRPAADADRHLGRHPRERAGGAVAGHGRRSRAAPPDGHAAARDVALPKLVWFREHDPEVFAAASAWVGIKELVLLRLCGERAVDHSSPRRRACSTPRRSTGTPRRSSSRASTRAGSPRCAGHTRHGGRPHRRSGTRPRPAGRHAGRDRGRRRPAREPGRGGGPARRLRVLHRTSGALRVVVERPSVDAAGTRLLLRAHPRPVGRRRGDQQRWPRPAVDERRAGARARVRTTRSSCSSSPRALRPARATCS
jgi:hypothetical protein